MAMDPVDGVITIDSSNQDISEALRIYGRDEILKVSDKYFGHLVSASAHFNIEGFSSRCSITVQMGSLPRMSADSSDKDMRTAFNQALDKVATQLRRTKRELREDKPARASKGVLPDGSRML